MRRILEEYARTTSFHGFARVADVDSRRSEKYFRKINFRISRLKSRSFQIILGPVHGDVLRGLDDAAGDELRQFAPKCHQLRRGNLLLELDHEVSHDLRVRQGKRANFARGCSEVRLYERLLLITELVICFIAVTILV